MAGRFIYIAFAFAVGNAAPAGAGDLSIEISAVDVGVGQLMVGVCQKDQFLDDDEDCDYRATLSVMSDPQPVVFKDVKPGRYAVQVFYDLDRNNKLKTNFIGIPREPVGFSHNLVMGFGPPRFSRAAFDVGEKDIALKIDMTAWNGPRKK